MPQLLLGQHKLEDCLACGCTVGCTGFHATRDCSPRQERARADAFCRADAASADRLFQEKQQSPSR